MTPSKFWSPVRQIDTKSPLVPKVRGSLGTENGDRKYTFRQANIEPTVHRTRHLGNPG